MLNVNVNDLIGIVFQFSNVFVWCGLNITFKLINSVV